MLRYVGAELFGFALCVVLFKLGDRYFPTAATVVNSVGWLFFAALVTTALVISIRESREWVRSKRWFAEGRCPACGYNRRGLDPAAPCPECSAPNKVIDPYPPLPPPAPPTGRPVCNRCGTDMSGREHRICPKCGAYYGIDYFDG